MGNSSSTRTTVNKCGTARPALFLCTACLHFLDCLFLAIQRSWERCLNFNLQSVPEMKLRCGNSLESQDYQFRQSGNSDCRKNLNSGTEWNGTGKQGAGGSKQALQLHTCSWQSSDWYGWVRATPLKIRQKDSAARSHVSMCCKLLPMLWGIWKCASAFWEWYQDLCFQIYILRPICLCIGLSVHKNLLQESNHSLIQTYLIQFRPL